MEFDTFQKCYLGEFSKLNDILADKYEAPIVQAPTPLEIQMAEQLKEQARQMEEMKRMMTLLLEAKATRKAEKERKVEAVREAEIARKAEKERNILIAVLRSASCLREAEIARKADEARKVEEERKAEEIRKAEEACKVEAAHKAEEERKAEAMRKTCAFLLTKGIEVVMLRSKMDESLKVLVRRQLAIVEEYSKARTGRADERERQYSKRICLCRDLFNEIKDVAGQIREKEKELAKPMEEERKRREAAEHLLRQEESRKRSAARIGTEFSIWNRRETQMGPSVELFTKNNHVWLSDRTPIMVDGKVCVGPRLGSYCGINLGAVLPGAGISSNCYTHGNGVTYDGRQEPRLY